MGSVALALVVYSFQVLFIVCAAAVVEALIRGSAATARLAYWRGVSLLCLALPLLASSARELPMVSVTFSVLPVERVTGRAASQILPEIGRAIPVVWACGAVIGLVWLLAGSWRIR